MQIPNNPDNPTEWFRLAQRMIADEGVFSQDQIATLNAMIEMIMHGVAAATRGISE